MREEWKYQQNNQEVQKLPSESKRNRLGTKRKQYGAVILILMLILTQFPKPMPVLAEINSDNVWGDSILDDDEGYYAGDFDDDSSTYAYTTPSDATPTDIPPADTTPTDTAPADATPADAAPANADFRKAMTSSNTETAEEFVKYINTFNHGGSGQLTATASGNTVTVEGSVTGAAKSLVYSVSKKTKETIIIDWKADYEGNGSTSGLLEFYGSALQFNMNGGKIRRSVSSDRKTYAFVFSSCQASFYGGTVQGELGIHIVDGTLSVNNGAVISSLDFAVYSRSSHIEITDGTLSVSGETANGIRLSESSELTMTDGSISSDGKGGRAIFAGENSVVDIQGGIISAAGPDGRTVYEYKASKITIIDSDISLSGLWVNETEASINEYAYEAYVALPGTSPFPTESSAITIIPKDADANISRPQMLDEHTWLFTIESGCLRQSYQVIIHKINLVKVETVDFGSLAAGYETLPAPQTITIENNGTLDIPEFTVTGGANYEIEWMNSPIPQGGSVTITVQPKSGLAEGVWRDNIIISAYGSVIAQVEAVIEILPASGRESEGSSSESTTTDSSVLIGTWERTDTGFWKFRLTTGRYAANRWGISDKRWYYFDAEGIMQTGWQYIGEVWYYLSTDADTKTNAQTKEGAMMTGWYYDPIYGGWFYFGPNGAMATGNREIDGKPYYFNTEPNGRQGILTDLSNHQTS